MGVCSFLFRKMAKRGFTLIEALIATVLVGACIMPIVGTMQNAESMTQRMVNDNKLQMLARSRMNLETSRANNEQKYIDETTGWLYEWYKNDGDKFPQSVATYSAPNEFSTATNFSVTNMFRVYRIAVKVKDNVILKSEKSDGTMENDADFKGLKQVVVTSQIVGEDGQFYILEDNSLTDNNYPTGNEKYKVDEKYLAEMGSISLNPPPDYVQQYSLVSLVTVPEVSSEYVYALDIKNNAVCSFDPVTGMMSKKYKLPGDKLYQAVFPSPDGKKLFLFGGTDSSVGNIGLFDIDPNSTTYSQFIGEKGTINRTGNGSSLNRENALYKTKFALRPDGDRAYAIQIETSSGIKGYYADGLTTSWASCQWFGVGTLGSIYDTATLFLTAGSDGFLYFGPFDDNSIKRHPMYNNTPLNLKFVETAKLPSSVSNLYSAAACVSPDSKIVYTLWHKKNDYSDSKIVLFDSLTFSYIKSINLNINAVTEIKVNDMEISADGRFIVLSCIDNDGANPNGKRVAYILKTSLLDNNNPINLDDYKAEFSDSEINSGSEYAIYSKLTGHFIVDNADKPILRSIDYNDILENSPTSGSTATVNHSIAQIDDSSAIITHHSARTPEIIYTTSKDENNKYKLKAIDTGLKEFNEEFEIELENNPTSVALSPNGDILAELTKNGSIARRYFFDTYLCGKTDDLSSISLFDTNLILSKKYKPADSSEYKYARAYWRKDTSNPIYCHSARIDPSTPIELSDNWIIRKVIGTNSGGAIILASNNANYSSNKKSLVDWYELKADKTGFERCGRWVSEGSDLTHFPPYNAIDMAISRDDRVLVFLSEAEVGSQKIYYANFFDFGTYNFGNKTQMKGMIVDFRDEDRNLNLTSANPVNGKLRAKEDNGQRIHRGYTVTDSFTNTYDGDSNYSTDFKNNPIKFDESSIKAGSTTPESKIFLGKNKRIFGYYNKISDNDGSISKVTIASFTPKIINSLGRVWINNSPYYDNNLIASSTSYPTPSDTGSNTYLIQLDQTASSKIKTEKFCADYDSDNFLESKEWKKFDATTGNAQNIELCSDLQELNNYIDILNRVAWSSSDEAKLANFAEISFGTVVNKLDVETALCKHIYGKIGTPPDDLHPRPGMYFNFYKYVPNGPMDISLLFCEGTFNDHRRVFSVYAEEQCFAGLNDFQPSLEAVSGVNSQSGKYKPIIKNGKVRVKDNKIDIRFTNRYNDPQDTAGVSAIKLKYYYDIQDGDELNRYGFEGQNSDLITTSNSHNLEKSSVTVGDSGTITTYSIKNLPSWVLSEWPFRKHYEPTAGNNIMDFEIPWKSGMVGAKATIYFMEHMAANNTAGKRVLKLSSDNASASYLVDFIKDADNHPPGWVFTKSLLLKPASSGKLNIKFEKISGDKPIFSGIKIDWYGTISYPHVLATASIKLKQNPSTYLDIVATETMPLKFEPFWIGKATNIQRKNNSNVVNFEASRFLEDDGYFYLCSSSSNDGSYIKKFTLNDTADLTANQVVETNCIQNMILSENKPYIYFNYLDGTNNNIYAIKESLSSSDCEKIATDTDNKANSVILLNRPYNRMKKKSSNIEEIIISSSTDNFASDRYGCNKAVAINGAIYLIGGDYSSSITSGTDDEYKKIYKFDPHLNKITTVTNFNKPIKNASAVAYDNTIYVFNGTLDSSDSNVCAYDVKNDMKIEYVASSTNVVESEEKLIFPLINVSSTKINKSKFNIADSNGITVIEALGDDQADNKQESNVSCLFDNDDSTYWLSDGHVTVGVYRSCNKNHYLKFEFPKSFTLKWIELTSKNEDGTIYGVYDWQSHYPTKFKISTSEGGLDLLSGNGVLSSECLNQRFYTSIDAESNTYYFEIPKGEHGSGNSYPWISIHELRFFGTEKKQIPTPSTLGMSPITDDTLTKITANHGGVCITPYGILRAGGEGTGSSTSQIYWPHAMADYDNERSGNKGTRGLCHSLADIASQTTDTNNWYFKDMSLVYHKGKAYGFGKAKQGGSTAENRKVISYDFDRNEWSYCNLSDDSTVCRSYAAAVSFGDEIYLFGGFNKNDMTKPTHPEIADGSIIAWNPETNTVRECGTIGNGASDAPLAYVSACAYGSDIYLFGGMTKDALGQVTVPTKKIYKFTP